MEIKLFNKSFNIIHTLIALGIWTIVLQNAGVIETKKEVKVMNTVDVQGNVDVEGSVIANVENTVDVNLSEINGDQNAFLDQDGKEKSSFGYNWEEKYNKIPISFGKE